MLHWPLTLHQVNTASHQPITRPIQKLSCNNILATLSWQFSQQQYIHVYQEISDSLIVVVSPSLYSCLFFPIHWLLFSSPDLKGHVSYCHHLASVVCPSKHFNLLLENHGSKWDQTWQECSFAWFNQVLLLSLRSVIQYGCQGP